MESYVKKFNEIGIEDVPSVGGKNASLGEMFNKLSSTGIRVPDGFATTAFAFRKFLDFNQITGKLTELLSTLNKKDYTNLKEISAKARALIANAKIPEEISKEIVQHYHDLFGGKLMEVAVRSSATAEDLPNASFAGQHESYLNIKGDDAVIEAVHKCFASLYTARAIKYREDNGFAHEKVLLSVGIQKMVRSDKACSGVAFTLEPESGFGDIIHLAGVWGLGENIVQGTVTPDEYYIFKPTLRKGKNSIIQKKLGSKLLTMVYADNDKNTTTINLETSLEKRNQYVLTNEEVTKLANWALKIEEHYHKPMDVEWAKDGVTNELFIIQARPETIHSQKNIAIIEEYELKEKGPVLTSGNAIGEKIATGTARVLQSPEDASKLKEHEIVVTDITSPDWDPLLKKSSAIITNKGGRTSHASIVAREQGVPAIVGCKNATTAIKDGQTITVSCCEGSTGYVYNGALKFVKNEINISKIKKPDSTKVMLILADPDKAFQASFYPNDGVGLLRLEFIITHLIQAHPMALVNFDAIKDGSARQKIINLTQGYPDKKEFFVDKLSQGVATIAAAFYPKEVIVRMSDFKTNEYANLIGGKQFEPEEENPMLGFRGASRYYSDLYKDGFELECAAIKKVRGEMGLTNLKIMIPFCRTVEEGEKVIRIMEEFGLNKKEDPSLQIYVMAEIPSNVILAEDFGELFDGFSIGSNDLTQLTLGIDRDSTLVADIFNEQNKAAKRMISMMIKKAKARGRHIGLCGQAPSDFPEFAQFLVQEGIDSISFNADALLKGIENINKAEKQFPAPYTNFIINRKEMIEIVEESFRVINKLSRKILKGYAAENILNFRMEVKKLRAFLRLLNTEIESNKPLIPIQLKTFYGYTGIIRNIQMNCQNLLKWATEEAVELPKHYLKIMEDEKKSWEMKVSEMMADNNFKISREEILKSLPEKLGKTVIKSFVKKKADTLKEKLNKIKDEDAIHTVRKILQDISYDRHYINQDILKIIPAENTLRQLTLLLNDFRDKCIQIELLSREYLDRIKDKREKKILGKMKKQLLEDKKIMIEQLTHGITKIFG